MKVRVLLLWVVSILFPGCEAKIPSNALIVGMDLSYPPFETIDAKGNPTGVSVDLAEALAAYLNRPLQIENIPFTGLIPSLQNGRIDCIISSLTDTKERRQSIAFSDPYLTIGLAMLVGKESGIQTLNDLDQSGKTLVVRDGTTGQEWARQKIHRAKVLVLEKEDAAILEVIQGKADAFVYDQMSIWKNAQKHSKTLRAILTPLQTESWAIGIRRDNNLLREQIDTFLKMFRKEGGFEKLGEKYLKDQKEAFKKAGVTFYF